MTETITDLSAAEKHALLFVAQCTIDGLDDEAPVWDTVGYTLTIGNLRDLLAEHAKQRELLGVAGRQLEAAEAQPCDHDSTAFEALERLHARIHRDFNFDAGECAPPTEDEPALRMMDDLVAFADEVYLPLADATSKPGQTAPVRIAQESLDLIRNTVSVWRDHAVGVGCGVLHPPAWYRARIADFEQLLALVAPAEPTPLESVVAEALADIATTPADPEPAPIRRAWLLEEGDD